MEKERQRSRVCFISPKAYQLFNPKVKSTFGGAEVQLYLLAQEIIKDDSLDIHFMVADFGQNKLEEYNQIKVWNSLNFKHNIIRQIGQFISSFNRINADIYLQRTLTPLSGLIALYCKFKRKKLIYMVSHNSETDDTHNIYKHYISKKLANLTFKIANVIIVQNNYQADKLRELKRCQSVLIRSGYSINDFNKNAGEYILWVARSMPWKQPEKFIELAKNFPQEHFVMICPPATENPGLSDKLAQEASNIKNLRFIKFVPFIEIDDYFRKAKAFVNTSKYEGFPNTFIQAAKNKVPILSLAVNPDYFITKYGCGYYCNNDSELLKKYLHRLTSDRESYNNMSQKAFQYAVINHDINKNSDMLLTILKNL
ncbi:glycosyltransferase family 4 protein [Patescibacteria group bacterium]